MVRGLWKGYPGLLVNCENCQSLIAYGPSDIQYIPSLLKKGIGCPYCKAYIVTDLQDAIINETNKEEQ